MQEKLANNEHEPEGQPAIKCNLEAKTLNPERKEGKKKWLQNQKGMKRSKETRRPNTNESYPRKKHEHWLFVT